MIQKWGAKPVGVAMQAASLLVVVTAQQPCNSGGSFEAVEPIAANVLVLIGDGDTQSVTVALNGVPIGITAIVSEQDPERSYLTLERYLEPGTLHVSTSNAEFSRELMAEVLSISLTPSHVISDHIYGVAFPESEAQIDILGPSVARWGGNATSLYNPNGHFTNAGNDWYFENRDSESADSWIGWIQSEGLAAFLSVPALDYVAKDATSYSYSVAKYGEQEATDPWNPDAGNGVLLDGTSILDNDPFDAGVGWDTDQVRSWLEQLEFHPEYVAVDNELDICSSTHRDIHPEAATYDELYQRFISTAVVIKDTQPQTLVAGISSCCWWYYWNSAAGSTDKDAHEGVDFIPWFLGQVAEFDSQEGRRHLDFLDIHYYPDGVFNDKSDSATRAKRLRSTRSLWDPTYIDESWIGTDVWATQTQPNRNAVMLIPRFLDLAAAEYPGTKLGVTEWNWGAEEDISGGLAVVDVLGIFGRTQLDLATYWTVPSEGSAVEAAFVLYRSSAGGFFENSLPVEGGDPDLLGVYAASDTANNLTIIAVNKDPTRDQILQLDGLPIGSSTVYHFSEATDHQIVTDAASVIDGVLVVPAYAAVRIAIQR